MLDTPFQRRVNALTPSGGAYLRVWLGTTPQLPAPPYVGSLPATREQALLLLSLSCAGIEPAQLAPMRVDDLLNADGTLGNYVRMRAETRKDRASRKVPMHPDIRRDVISFRARHPNENSIAFVRREGVGPNQQRMSEHGLNQWFLSVYRDAKLDGLTGRSGAKMFRDTEGGA